MKGKRTHLFVWKGGKKASFPFYAIKLFLLLFFAVVAPLLVKSQNSRFIFRAGADYRFYPIDIQDVPPGGYSSNGLPDDEKFWKTFSLLAEAGSSLSKTTSLSLQVSGRYNHLHWLQGTNFTNPQAKRAAKQNIKLDIFAIVEKRFRIKKENTHSLFTSLGLGVTNLHTKYAVFLQDTLPSGPTQGKLYEGDYSHFGLQLRVGYQYKAFRFSYNTYLIEGPDRTGLASLWMGISLLHEIRSQKERSGQISN